MQSASIENRILDNLFTLLGEAGAARLRATPLLVVSQRVAASAAEKGCTAVYVADSARDEDMLLALCELNEDVA